MLRVKTRIFIWVCFSVIVGSILLVFNNKAKISNVTVKDPSGKEEKITIPYNSFKDGKEGVFVYNMILTKTIFFSGKLHIIPDDCLERIVINGSPLPDSLFAENRCDCINGFYLNISPYLKNGENQLHLEIKNTHGFYGLKIRDITFYEKYIIMALLLFGLIFIDLKKSLVAVSTKFKVFAYQNKTLIWILFAHGILLILTLLASYFVNDVNLYQWMLIGVLLMSTIIPIIFSIYKNFIYGKAVSALFVLSILIWIVYVVILPYSLYSYDYEGHIKYVKYIFNTGEIPIASGGWMFYHPSFYYICATILWKIANINNHFYYEELLKILQAFSLVFFIIYCFFSLKIIDLLFRRFTSLFGEIDKRSKLIYLLVVSLFIFWPSNSIFSVRIGNDIMFNLFFMMSFYFTVQWWSSKKMIHILSALVFTSLDVWSKTNGMISLGVVGLLFLIRYFSDMDRRQLRLKYFYQILILASFSITTLYFSFHEKLENSKNDPKSHLIVGNVNGLGRGFDVGNKPVNYLTLNPIKFVEVPYTSSLEKDKGRDYFWFYLFKSSMFGEFSFNTATLILLAKALSLFFLFLLAPIITGFICGFKKKVIYIPVIVCLGMLIGSMIIFRIYYPYSCSNDFRYIFPTILPFTIFAGNGLLFFSKSKLPFLIGIIFFVGFITVSIVFQIVNISRI